VVFLGKAGFLWLIDHDNRRFHGAYQSSVDPIALAIDEAVVQNSNLYRMHQAGCRALTGHCESAAAAETGGQAPARLPRGALKTLRATLDKHYIDETKRLNGYLTVLTMAVTGGPFLGLLGTVWGVMNTFAAMAEAGEANIMAIAPGVASALSTTVVGLIVAIPALFAYNYLTSRIKNITVDLMVFADEFVLKVENNHGEDAA
jgi:biopolymer transport protein ExbB